TGRGRNQAEQPAPRDERPASRAGTKHRPRCERPGALLPYDLPHRGAHRHVPSVHPCGVQPRSPERRCRHRRRLTKRGAPRRPRQGEAVGAFTHSLDPFFRPATVAVLGASVTPGSVGSILMRTLLETPFGGVVSPVNPRRSAAHGVHCSPPLAAVPEPVDLAVIATPAVTVPGLVGECVAGGVKAAIIISAGFSELGTEGKALENQVRELARGRMRLIGPNCLGALHPPSGLNAGLAASMPGRGHVALLSQSGAICTSILDWARTAHVGFSTFVSVGAMVDVDFADLIDYFGDDPGTHSIILYME